MIKGLIHGMMIRFFRLLSSPTLAEADVKRLLERLQARGYSPVMFNRLMSEAYNKIKNTSLERFDKTFEKDQVYLHLPYHPLDMQSANIRECYQQIVQYPPSEVPISSLCTMHSTSFGNRRLIIAYSRPFNLGTFFSPRKVSQPGATPSVIIKHFDEAGGATNHYPKP